jgi:hypothetical protein
MKQKNRKWNFLLKMSAVNFKSACFLALPFFFSSCATAPSMLSVHTDYLSHENLASYHVNTPDPRLNNPSIGQRLIISWSLPKKLLQLEDLHLEITLRFRTREEIQETVSISESSGTFVFPLLNEDYISTRGILTYKIDLIGGGEILEEWRHQIWTELIVIKHVETPAPDLKSQEDTELNTDFEND